MNQWTNSEEQAKNKAEQTDYHKISFFDNNENDSEPRFD